MEADITKILTITINPTGSTSKIISERLGHSTIGITMDTYTHVLPNLQKEAALQFEQLIK